MAASRASRAASHQVSHLQMTPQEMVRRVSHTLESRCATLLRPEAELWRPAIGTFRVWDTEVVIGEARGDAAAGCALDEAELQEERLDHVRECVRFLGNRGGERVQADRSIREFLDQR